MLRLLDRSRAESTWFETHLAGQPVLSNFVVAEGVSRARPGAQLGDPSGTSKDAVEATVAGQLGGVERQIRWRHHGDFTELRFDHGLRLELSPNLASAFADGPAAADLREALLGPGLLLLLARQGSFALHASAIARPDARDLILLLGPSGSGKSSLARLAADAGAIRVADDIVVLDSDGRWVGPIPQLKLSPCLLPNFESWPVSALIWPNFSTQSPAPRRVELTAPEVRQSLIRDSVAARLYSHAQLAQHLDFVTRLSRQLPGYALNRQKSTDGARIVADNLAALHLLLA